jgi:hypothetical protein
VCVSFFLFSFKLQTSGKTPALTKCFPSYARGKLLNSFNQRSLHTQAAVHLQNEDVENTSTRNLTRNLKKNQYFDYDHLLVIIIEKYITCRC